MKLPGQARRQARLDIQLDVALDVARIVDRLSDIYDELRDARDELRAIRAVTERIDGWAAPAAQPAPPESALLASVARHSAAAASARGF